MEVNNDSIIFISKHWNTLEENINLYFLSDIKS